MLLLLFRFVDKVDDENDIPSNPVGAIGRNDQTRG